MKRDVHTKQEREAKISQEEFIRKNHVDQKNSFVLSVYRRPRIPGDHMKKPAFMIHFYEMPNIPAWSFFSRSIRMVRLKRLGGAAILLICLLASSNAIAGVVDDLQAEIQKLKAEVTLLRSSVSVELAQGEDVVNAISVALSAPQSLTGSIVSVSTGTTIDYPIHFKKSTQAVSALQFDLDIPIGATVLSVSPGIAAQAAGKDAVGNSIASTLYRVLVFGINQNVIQSGPIAVVKISIASSSTKGKKNMTLTNLSASSPLGAGVPLTKKDGSITVR